MLGQEQPETIETTLNYMKRTGDGVVYFDTYLPPKEIKNAAIEPITVGIQNARKQKPSRLDQEGFVITSHQYQPVDYDNQEEVRKIHYPEIARFVKRLTGAAYAYAHEHRVRNSNVTKPPSYTADMAPQYYMEKIQQGRLSSFKHVHSDYTPAIALAKAGGILQKRGQPTSLLSKHWMHINAWHPINTTIQKDPLALCDARSVDPQDVIPTILRGPHKYPTVCTFAYNPKHQWSYFPNMTPDETLFFSHFDSATKTLVPHSAFVDPTSSPDAPPRESIEVRLLLVFN